MLLIVSRQPYTHKHLTTAEQPHGTRHGTTSEQHSRVGGHGGTAETLATTWEHWRRNHGVWRLGQWEERGATTGQARNNIKNKAGQPQDNPARAGQPQDNPARAGQPQDNPQPAHEAQEQQKKVIWRTTAAEATSHHISSSPRGSWYSRNV